MEFRYDKSEMIAFIKSVFEQYDSDDFIECLKRLTKETSDKFLKERGSYLYNEIEKDVEFLEALGKLANICNDQMQQCGICPVKNYCNTYIESEQEKVSQDALKMVDLFCGAGGLSLGFTQEGFVTAFANDIEECCIDTYAHNHPETPRDHIILGDIKEIVNNIEELIGTQEIDVVVGGPPCQGFSMANRQRLIDDPRNQLYRSYVDVVKKVQPKFFVMENVKGMLSVAKQVKEDFETIGYNVIDRVLNAKDFGVPQNRERLIYIGNKIGIDNEVIFKEICENGKKTPKSVLEDALYGLRPLEASRVKNATEQGSELCGNKIEKNRTRQTNPYIQLINQDRDIPVTCNHKARYNNDRDIHIFARMEQGDRSDDPKIADIMPYGRRNDIFKDKYFKLESKKVCKTITAHMKFDCNMYIHPTQARGLTPREAARVQSYPDDYFFRGAYTKTYMQIGNSVPPLLGRAIARVIKTYVRKVNE